MTEAVKAGDMVSINYVGKLEDGTVFDSTEGRDSFQFEAGGQGVIPGMSSAVVGMMVGDEKTVEIPPTEAYGDHNPELVIRVANDRLPENANVGDVLSDGSPNSPQWMVVERTDADTMLDGNHPLAGKTLIFDVTLVGIG